MEFGSWKLEKYMGEIHVQALDKLSWELSVGGFTGLIDSMLPVAIEMEWQEEELHRTALRGNQDLSKMWNRGGFEIGPGRGKGVSPEINQTPW